MRPRAAACASGWGMRPTLAACVLALACNGAGEAPQQRAEAPDALPAKAAPTTFGKAIGPSPIARLAEIARSPAAFKNKTIVAQGKVTRVCQEQGCWLAIRDEGTDATVRMHGHAFFVPTTSAGKRARVQGTVVLTKDGHECDEMEAVGAALEIDATGVELAE